MRTVSTKPTATVGSRCEGCGLWYEFVHTTRGGRYLCRMSLEVAGLNRSSAAPG